VTVTSTVRADLLAAVRLARYVAPIDRAALGRLLYSAWFAGAGSTAPPAPGPQVPSLVARLRAAHAATGRLEAGWHARRVGHGGVLLAERAGELLELSPPDYLNVDHPAAPVRAGDRLAVTARRDGPDAGGGWWVTSSDAGPAPEEMVRVYWNCPPQSAAVLVAGLTGALERLRLTYTLKCPLTSELFDRVEPVVLYIGHPQWVVAKPALRAVHSSLVAELRPEVPPLTLRLGPGVAAAEDPADGRSFGQSRADAVADGVILAVERRLTGDEAATLAVVAERLAAHDISPARPYLRACSPPDLVTSW
jgi:hypothetical protein